MLGGPCSAGEYWFGSLHSPDLAQQVSWPYAHFARQLATAAALGGLPQMFTSEAALTPHSGVNQNDIIDYAMYYCMSVHIAKPQTIKAYTFKTANKQGSHSVQLL